MDDGMKNPPDKKRTAWWRTGAGDRRIDRPITHTVTHAGIVATAIYELCGRPFLGPRRGFAVSVPGFRNFSGFAYFSHRLFEMRSAMRKKTRWTDAEVEKLRSMIGKHPRDQIAQELGRPPGSVATKARELKMSLAFRRRRQPASVDSGPAGMDL